MKPKVIVIRFRREPITSHLWVEINRTHQTGKRLSAHAQRRY